MTLLTRQQIDEIEKRMTDGDTFAESPLLTHARAAVERIETLKSTLGVAAAAIQFLLVMEVEDEERADMKKLIADIREELTR